MTGSGTTRTVLMYLVIAMGLAAMIEGAIFVLKEGSFRDKVKHHPHEIRD